MGRRRRAGVARAYIHTHARASSRMKRLFGARSGVGETSGGDQANEAWGGAGGGEETGARRTQAKEDVRTAEGSVGGAIDECGTSGLCERKRQGYGGDGARDAERVQGAQDDV